jgi:hypothetical protein
LQVKLEAQSQPPSYGRIALDSTGPVSLADTSPQPTDFESIGVGTQASLLARVNGFVTANTGRLGPVWTCTPSENLTYLDSPAPRGIPTTGSFAGDACGAIAVVDAPGASDLRSTVLIVAGVLIAIAFERFFESRRRDEADADRQPPTDAAVPE